MSYVNRIIEAFGGVRPMAAAIEKPVSTVHSWKARGSIPDGNKGDVLRRSQEMRLGLTPSDFFPVEAGTDGLYTAGDRGAA